MSVKLVHITPNAEQHIMRCARVSSPNPTSDNPQLLTYCIKNGHWSIFEMADMCLEIQTNRAISAQILRHKSFSFQEFSQRYAEIQSFETFSARRQDNKNRQNSIDDLDIEVQNWFLAAQEQVQQLSNLLYKQALKYEIAKECARFLLPLSTSTKLYMKGSIRSWLHYFDVRCSPDTQLEHREIALRARNIFIKQFPNIAAAKGWSSV